MSFVLTVAEPITREIDAIVEDVCPGAGRRPMYGGIVFERKAGNHKTMVCGHFVYKSHVSLEFSNDCGNHLCRLLPTVDARKRQLMQFEHPCLILTMLPLP